MSEIFDIGHESDLSEYSSTVTDGGDLSQSAGAALASTSGGLACLIDDTNSIYGQKDFTELASTKYRFRFYIDPNSLTMGSSEVFIIARILNGTSARCQVELYYSSGTGYRVRVGARIDDWSTSYTSYYTISDAEHYVEVLLEYASGESANDGKCTLWVDGVQQEQLTSLDIYDISKPDSARLGAVAAIDAGTSGTLYLDEFVLRDDDTEIGAVSPPAEGAALPVISGQGIHSLIFGGQTVR